jgi:hypothetical protein
MNKKKIKLLLDVKYAPYYQNQCIKSINRITAVTCQSFTVPNINIRSINGLYVKLQPCIIATEAPTNRAHLLPKYKN